MKSTSVTEELEGPDELEDVQDLPESGVIEVEEVSVAGELRREAAVLPDDQGHQP